MSYPVSHYILRTSWLILPMSINITPLMSQQIPTKKLSHSIKEQKHHPNEPSCPKNELLQCTK